MHRILLILLSLLIYTTGKSQPAKSYKEGYYYNLNGQKIAGLISFKPADNRIHFKTDRDARAEKILIGEIKAVVLTEGETDSLVVLSEEGKENKKYFGKLLAATPTTKFYDKFYFYNGGGMNMTIVGMPTTNSTGSQPAYHDTMVWKNSPGYSGMLTIVMYDDGYTTYPLTHKNYTDVLSKAFANSPEIVQEIQSGKVKFRNIQEKLIDFQIRQATTDNKTPGK